MERDKIVDALGLGACALWLGLSAAAIWHGDAQMFARLGALGTAAAVGYFAMIKHSLPYPVGLHDKLHIVNARLNDEAEAVRVSLQNTTLLALGLRDLHEKTKNPVPGYVSELADERLIEHAKKCGPFPVEQWETKGAQLVEASKAADELVTHVAFRAGKLQALVVVVATLQWGFGDCAVNLTKCGAIQC